MTTILLVFALAQDPEPIARQLDALVARMERLATKLEATQPDDARRLRRALALLTTNKHAQAVARGIADRLGAGRPGAAIDDSKLLLDILDEVLRTLLDDDRADELARLDAMLRKVRDLIRAAATEDVRPRVRELTDEIPYDDAKLALENDDPLEGLRAAERLLQRRRDELASASVEEELARMLVSHNAVAAATIALAAEPVASREAAALSDREAALRDRAGELRRVVGDERASAFLYALDSIADDLDAASRLLADGELAAVQPLQKDITRAIEELIQSFKDRRRAAASGNAGSPSGGPGPKIPDLVQLRLIRTMQKNLLDRTRRFTAGFDTSKPMSDVDKSILRRLTAQEGKLGALLRDLIQETP